jgi:hypothetical protein
MSGTDTSPPERVQAIRGSVSCANIRSHEDCVASVLCPQHAHESGDQSHQGGDAQPDSRR